MTDAPYRPAAGDIVTATFRVTLVNATPAGKVVLRLEPVVSSGGPPGWDQVVWLDARQAVPAGRAEP